MLHDFDNAYDREVYTRANYTIGLNVAYFLTQYAEDFHVILVSSLDDSLFKKTKIHTAKDVDEAIALAKKLSGNEHPKTYMHALCRKHLRFSQALTTRKTPMG